MSRALLVGLDGGTFTILEPLMRAGAMPFLAEFMANGVHAELQSVIPPLTPPAWATITTGRSPGHHGVFDFFAFESPTSREVRITNSSDVRAETMWSIANRHGLTATVLNFPLTAPPRPLAGCLLPGWVLWRFLRRSCYPPDLYDRIKDLPRFDPRELAMNFELERKAMGTCPPAEQEEWIAVHLRRDLQWFDILEHLMCREPHDLTAIVFDGVDKLQHLFWHLLDPRCPTPEAESGAAALCMAYFRQLDQLVARAVQLAGDAAHVFFVSDHGFGPSHEIVHVNAWLERHGYLAWTGVQPPDGGASDALGLGSIGWLERMIDWTATTAYAHTPSSNGIHICVAGKRGPHGVAPSAYAAFRDRLREGLLGIRDGDGEAVVTAVRTREEAFPGPLSDGAPDLTVTLRDGGFLSTAPSGSVVTPRPVPVGTHRPEGIFLAGGPGVRAGSRLPALSVRDVAPIVLHTLDVPVPIDLEGRIPDGLFTPSWMARHPVRTGGPTEVPEAFPRARSAQKDEEQVMARLRALGYVE
jgi:predicted AlkP superfamily phosphohydrolase/phosphomutase